MGVQLDVEILDRGPAVLLVDGRAVDQLAGADQPAVDEDRVVRRDQQIGVRHGLGERAAPDADRRHGLRVRMRGQVDAAAADPLHRLGASSPFARVRTMSPCSRLSTIRSPVAVRMRVPAAKQGMLVVIVSGDCVDEEARAGVRLAERDRAEGCVPHVLDGEDRSRAGPG